MKHVFVHIQYTLYFIFFKEITVEKGVKIDIQHLTFGMITFCSITSSGEEANAHLKQTRLSCLNVGPNPPSNSKTLIFCSSVCFAQRNSTFLLVNF